MDQPADDGQREDPIAADRKRRVYESLFASNVVLKQILYFLSSAAARSSARAPFRMPSIP